MQLRVSIVMQLFKRMQKVFRLITTQITQVLDIAIYRVETQKSGITKSNDLGFLYNRFSAPK